MRWRSRCSACRRDCVQQAAGLLPVPSAVFPQFITTRIFSSRRIEQTRSSVLSYRRRTSRRLSRDPFHRVYTAEIKLYQLFLRGRIITTHGRMLSLVFRSRGKNRYKQHPVLAFRNHLFLLSHFKYPNDIVILSSHLWIILLLMFTFCYLGSGSYHYSHIRDFTN